MRKIILVIGLILLTILVKSCSDDTPVKKNSIPTKPVLIFPANSQEIKENILALDWEDSIDSDGDKLKYSVYLFKFGETQAFLVKKDLPDTKFQLSGLKKGKYKWKVEVTDTKQVVASDVFIFRVNKQVKKKNNKPTKPVLIFPANSQEIKENILTLDWEDSIDSDGDELKYSVYLSKNGETEFSLVKKDLLDTKFQLSGLKKGKYKWKVEVTDTKEIVTSEVFTFTVKLIPADRVFVEGGEFQMGNNENYREKPVRKVKLSNFYISKYEVTNSEYAEFLNIKGNQEEKGRLWLKVSHNSCQIEKNSKGVYKAKPGKDKYPVILVTWYGAKAYAEWKEGRLPTEAEWEYAARGGNKSKNNKYSGSNILDDVAWYYDNSMNPDNNIHKGKGTHIVGTKKSNELGIYDMSGNAYEWCSDWYDFYAEGSKTNPKGPKEGTYRVLRGGCWNYFSKNSLVTSRKSSYPYETYKYNGFRVVFLN